MKIKKKVRCMMIVAALLLSLCLCVSAAEGPGTETFSITGEMISGRFEMDVSANRLTIANSSFPLDEGAVVTINALYTPSTASVDFGLVDAEGTFYYLRGSNGNFNRGILIENQGEYRFAVRNNSNYTVVCIHSYITL